VDRPPGGLTAERGRVVLGLGGVRACEGVRGRARACFTLSPRFDCITQLQWFAYQNQSERCLTVLVLVLVYSEVQYTY
jgi:hypothetical protein